MVFSSVEFLFLFFPIVVVGYLLCPTKAKNYFLLLASLLFYTWGSGKLLFLLLVSILGNYAIAFGVHKAESKGPRQSWVGLAVVLNLGLLGYYKYFNFFLESINTTLAHFGALPIEYEKVLLPIGISFFTFQALSYQIDLFRGRVELQRSLARFALFISLFPQLIAGPILRYRDLEHQLRERKHSPELFFEGVWRFIGGLAKKGILADGIAPYADITFGADPTALSPLAAWIGVTAFFFQIYFDFSGYSDMAIGAGKMFGFQIRENFNFPYIARSITSFWQRWHISLTTWFRDYLYQPLASKDDSKLRTYINVYIVFVLCGLWHGANWTFILFGLYFGNLLVLERWFLARLICRLPKILQHLYVLPLLISAGVLFRSPNIGHAWEYYTQMFAPDLSAWYAITGAHLWSGEMLLLFALCTIFSTPVVPAIQRRVESLSVHYQEESWRWKARFWGFRSGAAFVCGVVLFLAATRIASQAYQPFIYFQF